ncbi:uncharacterized protein ACBT57_012742 isoform 1-T2 [Dama dama]
MTGFCRIWIPNYGNLAKPLYKKLRGKEEEPLDWDETCKVAFNALKESITTAPALGLPNLEKPFRLYVSERIGTALGMLGQMMGPVLQPVAYLSKQLDEVARGWPTCLRAVAATALMVKEASRLTLGQPTTVYTPHQVQAVLKTKGDRWMTGGKITQYQALLLDTPEIRLRVCQTLNPATLLPDPPTSPLDHQCIQIIDELYSSRPDLSETPLSDPEENWYTDGSSFVEKGERKAGYAVVSLEGTKKSGSLPPDTSAQKAELFALTRALELGKKKKINVYTDSKYAFLILHAHAAIKKKKRCLTTLKSVSKRPHCCRFCSKWGDSLLPAAKGLPLYHYAMFQL